jgi:hypothetical protein
MDISASDMLRIDVICMAKTPKHQGSYRRNAASPEHFDDQNESALSQWPLNELTERRMAALYESQVLAIIFRSV